MACIHVRLPHYIAAFLRNRSERESLRPEDEIRLSSGDPLYQFLLMNIVPNLRNRVNIDCLSDSQWDALRRGKMLVYKRSGFPIDINRRYAQPLTLYEIFTLCDRRDLIRCDSEGLPLRDESGQPLGDYEYNDEYVLFRLPRTVFRNGRETLVQSNYYLPDVTPFITQLRQIFVGELARFVAKDREILDTIQLSGIVPTRTWMNSIDRFMLRYEIRDGRREREQLKKALDRVIKSGKMLFFNDESHGAWTKEERLAAIVRQPDNGSPASRHRGRRVVCETTGEVYDSIAAFARAYRVRTTVQVLNAIRNHWKIHGVYVSYYDELHQ